MKKEWFVIMISLVILVGGIVALLPSEEHTEDGPSEMKTFASFEELTAYLNRVTDNSEKEESSYSLIGGPRLSASDGTMSSEVATSGSSDHSTTNIQVEGVDEGDIVKNDGKYAYVVSKNKTTVFIVDVYPPEQAKIVSKIDLNWTIDELYLDGDKLVVLGRKSYYYYDEYDHIRTDINSYYSPQTFVNVYDLEDKGNPILDRSVQLNGTYINSRLIGDYLYLIVNQPVEQIKNETDLPVSASEIYYVVNYTDYYYYFTNIVSINVQNAEEEPQNMMILLGSSNNIYVSTKNIYITHTRYDGSKDPGVFFFWYFEPADEITAIHRISIDDGYTEYQASGEVPGRVLNRFSMDEYKRYFRIATTTGQVWRSGDSSAKNHVYVLDMGMNVVGGLNDIAPGERIYSARFMGKRAYLVTFKKVDPFFVIDLANPYAPNILGELKIPGYSNYLHPYDENHVIGIGKDCVDMGDFAWYQGVKISLFDVSDVNNPKEISQYIIGDRGTGSQALYDPHAFLFSKEKNLLVIPISLAEINESKYPNGASPSTSGEHTWSGAYVFDISEDSGIDLAGRISHDQDMTSTKYYYYSSYQVKRSFYIEDTLYTVSDSLIKANDLDDLQEINSVELSGQ
ncbi:MAG: beta-propeller domain-containing protein [Methanomassiliicoccales archaeon]|nr:MAG: beta-propeller domain-containing protein [Methanomassiliicoccales archaeon]